MHNPWATFPGSQSTDAISFVSSPHPALNRFLLPNGEHVTCAYWNGLFQITGTDIGGSPSFHPGLGFMRGLMRRSEGPGVSVRGVWAASEDGDGQEV